MYVERMSKVGGDGDRGSEMGSVLTADSLMWSSNL